MNRQRFERMTLAFVAQTSLGAGPSCAPLILPRPRFFYLKKTVRRPREVESPSSFGIQSLSMGDIRSSGGLTIKQLVDILRERLLSIVSVDLLYISSTSTDIPPASANLVA